MTTLIENYRGIDIYFDADGETFISMIENGTHKKSFSSAKKFVDDYIKENASFKPFPVHNEYDYKHILTVVGIRKDGRFMTENARGDKGQMSEYDETRWYIPNPENHKHYERIKELGEQKEALNELIEAERNKIVVSTLKSVKESLIRY